MPETETSPGVETPVLVTRLIKSECGLAKYDELSRRPGAFARVRLAWFLLIAAIRDWSLPARGERSQD